MPVHTLLRTQIIHTTLDEAWKFFSNPHNLARITPPSLDFRTLTEVPDEIYSGLMIRYRVRPLFSIPMEWLTEITHVVPRQMFVDEQRSGPYRIWHHEHHFRDLGDGRIEMLDRVTYQLPFGWLGNLAHPILVAPQVKKIFDHRIKAVDEIFKA